MSDDFGRDNYIPGLTPEGNFEGNTFMLQSSHEDKQRIARAAYFWSYYNGKQENNIRYDEETMIAPNFCAAFVNKGATFLMGNGWSIDEEDEPNSDKDIKLLNDLWSYNKKDLTCFETAQLGGCMGDVGWLFMPDDHGLISITVVPSVMVEKVKHPTQPNTIVGIKIQFPLSDITGSKKGGKLFTTWVDSVWIRQYIDDKEIYSKEHGIGEIPFVWIRNYPVGGSSNGRSDLAPILEMNDHYSNKLSETGDIVSYYVSPTTVVYGAKVKKIDKGTRKVWSNLPEPSKAKVENLTLDNNLEAADTHLKTIKKLMHQLGDMPELVFGESGDISNTSGVAIHLLYQPVIDITTIKHISYGQGIKDANRIMKKFGIKYGAIKPPVIYTPYEMVEYFDTSITWNSFLPMDKVLELNMLLGRLDRGAITVRDFFTKLGVKNVQAYIKELTEDRDTGRNFNLWLKMQQAKDNLLNMQSGSVNYGGTSRNLTQVEKPIPGNSDVTAMED